MPPENGNRPELSVIVCTRDRAAALARRLPAFAAVESPGFRYEFILVDNGSRDGTAAVFAEFLRENPGFPGRSVFEPAPGLARARNRGVGEARGEILVFTDDDVSPDRGWLRALLSHFRSRPEISGAFGRVEAGEGVSPLRAVKREEAEAVFSLRRDAFRVGHGNNMAFRRGVFSAVGPFDPRLGAGSPRESAEDTEFAYRVLARGFRLAYLPAARVTHHPEDSRALADLVRGYDRGLAFFLGSHFRKGDREALKIVAGRAGAVILQRIYLSVRNPRDASPETRLEAELRRVPRLFLSFIRGFREDPQP